MLTAYQCETAAYITEYGELLCPECFDQGDAFARPLIRYTLDEEQTARSEGWLDWDYLDEVAEDEDGRQLRKGPDDRWHVEACGCEPELLDEDGHELLEAYVDSDCRDEDDPIPNPPAPRWVPCGACGARDGEPHRAGCRVLGGVA